MTDLLLRGTTGAALTNGFNFLVNNQFCQRRNPTARKIGRTLPRLWPCATPCARQKNATGRRGGGGVIGRRPAGRSGSAHVRSSSGAAPTPPPPTTALRAQPSPPPPLPLALSSP